MIISDTTPITYQDPLPDTVDVVIIGAGVIGMATAWFLIKNKVSVLVCDKGRIAGEQSSRNWGWVRQQGRDAAELPIMMESIRIWESLAAEIGEDFGFCRHGVLFLAATDSELAEYEQWLSIARRHGLDTRLLSAAEVDKLIKNQPDGQWCGALYTPSDGRAEPFLAVPALARAAHQAGCRIREHCAVRALETAAGRTAAVVTEHGRVRTQRVVCAGGAWSSLFAGNLGVYLPQLTVRSTVARTDAATDIFAGNAADHKLAFRRRQDGGYTLALTYFQEHYLGADSFRFLLPFLPALRMSWREIRLRFGDGLFRRLTRRSNWPADAVTPFEETRVLNPAPSALAVAQLQKHLADRLPGLAATPIAEAWAGMIDVTPDVVPVIDEVSTYPGFFVATGFSGHGFGIGPGAGRVMADLLQGNTPGHDLDRFRLSRFTDGSRLELGPAL